LKEVCRGMFKGALRESGEEKPIETCRRVIARKKGGGVIPSREESVSSGLGSQPSNLPKQEKKRG